MANTHANLNSLFTDIANSIRNKTKDTSTIKADNFPDAIDSISGGETCSLYRANDDGSFDRNDICFTTTDGEVKDAYAVGVFTVNKNSTVCLYQSQWWNVSGNIAKIGEVNNDVSVYNIIGDATITYVCCFVAGTKITMSDNSIKNIEDIAVGDFVKSYDTETHELYDVKVKRLVLHPNSIQMSDVVFSNGAQLSMTSYHPLLTTTGWHSITNHDGYPTLVVGDEVITENGTTTITNITNYEADKVMTYTLDVENLDGKETDNDNFFANGICAHNARCPAM